MSVKVLRRHTEAAEKIFGEGACETLVLARKTAQAFAEQEFELKLKGLVAQDKACGLDDNFAKDFIGLPFEQFDSWKGNDEVIGDEASLRDLLAFTWKD